MSGRDGDVRRCRIEDETLRDEIIRADQPAAQGVQATLARLLEGGAPRTFAKVQRCGILGVEAAGNPGDVSDAGGTFYAWNASGSRPTGEVICMFLSNRWVLF